MLVTSTEGMLFTLNYNGMIEGVFKFLVDKLDEFGQQPNQPYKLFCQAANIANATLASSSTMLDDVVILTLVKVDEEQALKNNPDQRIFLNLYILASASSNDYPSALKQLDKTIRFFNIHRSFRRQKFPDMPDDLQELNCCINNLTFEQIYNLWSALGGKYLPSVIYKIQLVWAEAPKTPVRRVEQIGIADN